MVYFIYIVVRSDIGLYFCLVNYWKVDWTPELHRRFVQAVEQLGVDKAVPSRILEIMGIDCLTRHNIASHLQVIIIHRNKLNIYIYKLPEKIKLYIYIYIFAEI